MADPTPGAVADIYTRRSLALIRLANGLATSADADLRALGLELRSMLLDYDPSATRRATTAMLREIDAAISRTFADIAERQLEEMAHLVEIEASFAARAGFADKLASDAALRRALTGMLVQGAPLADQWRYVADSLSRKIGAAVRDAIVQELEPTQLAAVIGEGSRMTNGLLDHLRRTARTLTGTAVDTAAYAGRLATFRASNVSALQWHSVLDSHTTVGCALRANLLYTLDLAPIGHDVPIERPPPRHWNCRSILLPMKFREGAPMKVSLDQSFKNWLDAMTPEEQDDVLGVGRADLYRRGVITQSDLVNQRGRLLTLDELRRLS